ncbi:hypothetical protein BJX63DRAFT_409354 [Aspergillus granulosus]|uniref:Uncharacterized protein n=1 Tax=Aspergillus granulosus TaxID=176169 RepID=A0ABR4GYZ7_9EURO
MEDLSQATGSEHAQELCCRNCSTSASKVTGIRGECAHLLRIGLSPGLPPPVVSFSSIENSICILPKCNSGSNGPPSSSSSPRSGYASSSNLSSETSDSGSKSMSLSLSSSSSSHALAGCHVFPEPCWYESSRRSPPEGAEGGELMVSRKCEGYVRTVGGLNGGKPTLQMVRAPSASIGPHPS